MERFGVLVLMLLAAGAVADSMTNSWAVEIQSGGREAADQLASKHGFINLGQVEHNMCMQLLKMWTTSTPPAGGEFERCLPFSETSGGP